MEQRNPMRRAAQVHKGYQSYQTKAPLPEFEGAQHGHLQSMCQPLK